MLTFSSAIHRHVRMCFLLLVAGACGQPSEPCDSRTFFNGNACELRSPDASVAMVAPDAGPAKTDGAASMKAPGDTCLSHADCTGMVDYCVKRPPATEGYCARKGCEVDPKICPPGWMCFDLGVFAKGEPNVCIKP